MEEVSNALRFFTLLLLLAFPTLVCALGLGDIELKSHLGEPLSAQITISDIDGFSESSCFSATDASDSPVFTKASVTLMQGSEGQRLSITTHEIITEPIVNLRLSFHCDTNLNREYVLLLDPAPLTSTEQVATPEPQPASANPANKLTDSTKGQIQAINKHITALTTPRSSNLAKEKSAYNEVAKKPVEAALPVDKKLAETNSERPQSAIAITTKPDLGDKIAAKPIEIKATANKPALVISGGNTNSIALATQPGLASGLNAPIDPAKVEASVVPLTPTDAADEVAMMTTRLAHLEKQITNLQNQNAQLLIEADRAKNSGFKWLDQPSGWLQDLLIVLSIITILAGAEWLRRKILRNRLNRTQANWFESEAGTLATVTSADSSKSNLDNSATTSLNEAVFAQATYDQSSGSSQSRSFTNSPALTSDDKYESENVLDHADVFIAHGRPALAIQLLQSHLTDLPAESPAIWLKLFNLLTKEGAESEYDQAVIKCKQHFNIKIPSFADATINGKSTIEDYPHVVARIEDTWGSPLATELLNDLIYNQQSQPREGFELGTFEELFFLKQISEILNPSKQPNLWTEAKLITEPQHISQPAMNQISADTPDAATTITEAHNELIAATSDSDSQTPLQQATTSPEVYGLTGLEEEAFPLENTQETQPSFLADEIDFSLPSLPGNEIGRESAPEVNLQNAEIVFESERVPALDFKADLPENKSSVMKQAASNIIEWDLPKLDKP